MGFFYRHLMTTFFCRLSLMSDRAPETTQPSSTPHYRRMHAHQMHISEHLWLDSRPVCMRCPGKAIKGFHWGDCILCCVNSTIAPPTPPNCNDSTLISHLKVHSFPTGTDFLWQLRLATSFIVERKGHGGGHHQI